MLPALVLAAVLGDLILGALTSWSTDLSDEQSPTEKAVELVRYLVATLQPPPMPFGNEVKLFLSEVTLLELIDPRRCGLFKNPFVFQMLPVLGAVRHGACVTSR